MVKAFFAVIIAVTICIPFFGAGVEAVVTEVDLGLMGSDSSSSRPTFYTRNGEWHEDDVTTFHVSTSNVKETAIKIGGLRAGDELLVEITNSLGTDSHIFHGSGEMVSATKINSTGGNPITNDFCTVEITVRETGSAGSIPYTFFIGSRYVSDSATFNASPYNLSGAGTSPYPSYATVNASSLPASAIVDNYWIYGSMRDGTKTAIGFVLFRMEV